jgi:hypothetical protein
MLKKMFIFTFLAILFVSRTWATDKLALGVQAKYITGVGFTVDAPITKYLYFNGSASWLLLLADISAGLGFRATNNFDVLFRLHGMKVADIFGGGSANITWLEPALRLRLSKRFWIEGGVLMTWQENETIEVVPNERPRPKKIRELVTAPNVGIVFRVF